MTGNIPKSGARPVTITLLALLLLMGVWGTGCQGQIQAAGKQADQVVQQQNPAAAQERVKPILTSEIAKARLTSQKSKPSIPAQKPESPQVIICLDPGHPSEVNSGLALQNGTTETHINWQVTCLLKEKLEKLGYHLVLTKSSEREKVTNKQRALLANAAKADFMLRLHCDSGSGQGFTFYYPNRPGKAYGKSGPALSVMRASQQLATKLSALMGKKVGALSSNGIKPESKTYVGSRQGALTGSIFAEVPVVTMEMCFLSNKEDARYIKSKAGQEELALRLAAAIDGYVRCGTGKNS